MIAPGNRLLFLTAVAALCAAAGALVSAPPALCLAPLAALAIVAGADALAGISRLREVKVVAPEVTRMSKDGPGAIQLRIDASGSRISQVDIGLPLPSCFRCDDEVIRVALPPDAAHSAIQWPCVPLVRGRFEFNRCYFASHSPLRCWDVRGSSECRSEIRVYPNLGRERKRLAALFLNRGNYGVHRQRLVGQGREFEKLRDYIPGDSYEDIHWKATAKRRKPVTKLYQVERTQAVYVAIDASRLSARETGGEPALERFVASAAVLQTAAERQNDVFGLITFSDRVTKFIRAASGRSHFKLCRDVVYTLQPQACSPDYDELCTFIRLNLRRRSLVIVLTDLGDPVLAESFARNVQIISRQHVVLVVMIQPDGVEQLFSAADAVEADQLYGKLGGHMIWQSLREVGRVLARKGVNLHMAQGEGLSAELVARYLDIKARQIL